MRPRLEARQRLVSQLDPNHPTWAVLYQVDDLYGCLNTADVLRDPKVGFDQRWADLVKVGQEVKQLEPALLSAAPPPRMEIQAPDYVHSAVRADDAGRAYVLLASPDSASAANVRVTVPKAARLRILDHGEERLLERPDSQGECPLTVPPMGAMTLLVKAVVVIQSTRRPLARRWRRRGMKRIAGD